MICSSCNVFISIFIGLLFHESSAIYNNGIWKNGISNEKLTKVQLTQKGYIQFLRYTENVPSITEYTFCIWMKSYDLSHAHPLLSYSRNEKERLIRVWISPGGKSLNLELHGVPVFEIPTQFREHRWYHVCQSWDSSSATWEVFINDKKLKGRAPRLTGLIIKAGGDIVIAQEYTDFNKGLEDGVEGEIFGFNFVLSATSKIQRYSRYSTPIRAFEGYRKRRSVSTPGSNRYLPPPPHSIPNGIFDAFAPNSPPLWAAAYFSPVKNNKFAIKTRTPINPGRTVRINPGNELFAFQTYPGTDDAFGSENHKSTGMILVEMSRNCRIGKGAPFRGEKVLVNWRETKVRVFGGAILKQVEPFC